MVTAAVALSHPMVKDFPTVMVAYSVAVKKGLAETLVARAAAARTRVVNCILKCRFVVELFEKISY